LKWKVPQINPKPVTSVDVAARRPHAISFLTQGWRNER
jgi:hypothetical protein